MTHLKHSWCTKWAIPLRRIWPQSLQKHWERLSSTTTRWLSTRANPDREGSWWGWSSCFQYLGGVGITVSESSKAIWLPGWPLQASAFLRYHQGWLVHLGFDYLNCAWHWMLDSNRTLAIRSLLIWTRNMGFVSSSSWFCCGDLMWNILSLFCYYNLLLLVGFRLQLHSPIDICCNG